MQKKISTGDVDTRARWQNRLAGQSPESKGSTCDWTTTRSDVLTEPPETLSVTLTHDNRAHKEFDGSDILEGNFALAGRLVESQSLAKLLFAHCSRGVNLVAENQERHLCKTLDAQESVELCSGLCESLVVCSVDEENDSVDFREVVLPQSAS